MTKKSRLGIAVSGGGRSLENFIDQQSDSGSLYQVAGVIASRPDCRAVEIAKQHDLPVFVDQFPANPSSQLIQKLEQFTQANGIEWLALAGFIRIFPILDQFRDRLVNIHPALLPQFGGRGMYGDAVHKAVIAAGAPESGATVHFVNERYDEGQVIAQSVVPIKPGDDWKTLKSKVFESEKILYPNVINQLIAGQLPKDNGQVVRID